MKILLMGGSGIISSEICKYAIDNGDDVSIFNRGRRTEEINSAAKLIIGDIRNDSIEVIREKLDTFYDVVVDFISYNPTQLKKTLDIVENRCKQFVFVSSATAYSPEAIIPFTEETALENKLWKYSQDKADCEEYLTKRKPSCEYTIIRPYVTYGKTRIPLQVAPLEYYTIINRIKLHKPVVVVGDNVRCTLTNSTDFAVGAYGLFLNSNSYRQAFHITGDYRTTWKKVIEGLAEKIGVPVTIIEVPLQYIIDNRKRCGFDADEIIGDKGRHMIFDNSKIKSVVPEFEKFRSFEEALDDTLTYFDNEAHRKVNYKWDALLDKFIEKYAKDNKIVIDRSSLTVASYATNITDNERKVYQENRFMLLTVIGKIKRKLGEETVVKIASE